MRKLDGHSVIEGLSDIERLLDVIAKRVEEEGCVEIAFVLWDASASVAWTKKEIGRWQRDKARRGGNGTKK